MDRDDDRGVVVPAAAVVVVDCDDGSVTELKVLLNSS
jgi:hypothetical protein